MTSSISERLTAEVSRLFPAYAQNPDDVRWNRGNAAFLCIGPDGVISGRLFGDNPDIQQKCYELATRKVVQVWRTGYHTGHFEELIFSGKLDEGAFGIQKPAYIGWEGGVPLFTATQQRVAAAFSGFRGAMDIEIIERAAVAAGLSTVSRG